MTIYQLEIYMLVIHISTNCYSERKTNFSTKQPPYSACSTEGRFTKNVLQEVGGGGGGGLN